MIQSRRRRVFVAMLVLLAALCAGGYFARDSIRDSLRFSQFSGTRADWELLQLRQQIAKGQADETHEALRAKSFEIADKNPGTRTEMAAYLTVAREWPNSEDAPKAHESSLQAVKRIDIGDLADALHDVRPHSRNDSERRRVLAAALIKKVENQPDHPAAARLLCEAAVLIHPSSRAETAPVELHQVAELIQANYTPSPDLANFCEVVCNLGNSRRWSQPFEPHVRRILEVNQDRYVQCSAHFALASIVRSGGIERQAEAKQIYESFLEKFDGQTQYHAQSVEELHCQSAKQVLEAIQQHGLGMPTLETVGLDLEGRPMSLADYQGRVVLISFWATWCAPCMKAIPDELELLERFGSERFAIVGVNADENTTVALEAVEKHGINWRSFQNKREDGTSIESDWHIAGYPSYYLLDADGLIARNWQGFPPRNELETAIGKLIENAERTR